MRNIKTIETDRYEPMEDNIHVKHVGMITAQEAFDQLKQHLTAVDLLPDEYFIPSSSQNMEQELPNFSSAICHTDWGGSEGIYIDIGLAYFENRERKFFPLATGKTLDDSGDAFVRMSRIAAECSILLNGRGSIVKVSEPFYENLKVSEWYNTQSQSETQTKKSEDEFAVNHLLAFIEEEVPFRMKEVLDIETSPDILQVLIEELKDHNDVMFDYDALDGWLMDKYEELTADRESPDQQAPKPSLDDLVSKAEDRAGISSSNDLAAAIEAER